MFAAVFCYLNFRDAFIIHVATLSVNLTLRVGGWVKVCDAKKIYEKIVIFDIVWKVFQHTNMVNNTNNINRSIDSF